MLKVFVYNNGKDKDKWTVINWKTKRVIGEFDELLVYNCERTTYKKNKGFVGICLPTTPHTIKHAEFNKRNGKRLLNNIPIYSRIYFDKTRYPKGIRRTLWDYELNIERYYGYDNDHLKDFCDKREWHASDYYEEDDDDLDYEEYDE